MSAIAAISSASRQSRSRLSRRTPRLSILADHLRSDDLSAQRGGGQPEVKEREKRKGRRGGEDRCSGEQEAAGRDGRADTARDGDPPLEPPAEYGAAAPRRALGPQRAADANQVRAVGETREPDVIRLRPEPPGAEFALARLHGFPTLFDGREIPARTVRADDPEPALGGIERQTPPDGEMLDDVISSERLMAVKARRVHRGVNME